jgi:glycosyltransferase involved in cell wall biosynthesis
MAIEKKRIFVVSPYPVYPVADGCARRIDGISRLLVAKGWEVYLFAPRPQERKTGEALPQGTIHLIPYSRKRKYNYFINLDLSRALKKHIAERPDLIILNFPYLSAVVGPLARKHKIPVHLDAHNVEHQRFKGMGRPFVALLIYLFERYAVKNARSISVTSAIDAGTIRKKFGRKSTVIGNFIDSQRFYPLKKEDKAELKKALGMNFPKIVSYFGSFTNISTKQAYKIIRDEIAPRLLQKDPQIKIAVIGKGLKKGEPPVENMVLVGEVERIEPYIQVSDLVIVPLLSGGGTRFKILEALGCGIPVLSTPKGNEGLDLKPKDGVILSEVEEFPERIVEFFNQESSSSGFRPDLETFVNKYTLSGIATKIDLLKTFGMIRKNST